VVLTGAGDKVFSRVRPGRLAARRFARPKHFRQRPSSSSSSADAAARQALALAANGHVLAGGMGLALSCDLVIAKGGDLRTPEINVGAFPT